LIGQITCLMSMSLACGSMSAGGEDQVFY